MGRMTRPVSLEIAIETRGRGFVDVTQRINRAVREGALEEGLANVFIRHTSASLLISENADPDVLRDLETFLFELVPDGDPRFVHTAEGPDDMPSHVRAALTQTSLTIPVQGGKLHLGTWQAVYLWEHRAAPHRRVLSITLIG
jgi:secondary thiamine-phosphate synthase enzyme